jgi:hypothetical protein
VPSNEQPEQLKSDDPFATFDAIDGALPAVLAMSVPADFSGMSGIGSSSTGNLLGGDEGLAGRNYGTAESWHIQIYCTIYDTGHPLINSANGLQERKS